MQIIGMILRKTSIAKGFSFFSGNAETRIRLLSVGDIEGLELGVPCPACT